MRRSDLALFAALAALASVAAGCGGASGGGGSSGSAAGLVPGDAVAFITVSTDTGGTQLKNAQAVLDKFPAHTKLIASLEKSLASERHERRSARELGRPRARRRDPEGRRQACPGRLHEAEGRRRVHAALKKAKTEQISGWTVFASTQAALDAVKNRTTNLSDAPDYQDASKSLPGDTLASAFAGKSAFALAGPLADKASSQAGSAASAIDLSKLGWVAGAVTSHDDGIEVEFHAHSTSAAVRRRELAVARRERSPAACWRRRPSTARATSRASSASALDAARRRVALTQVQKVLGVSVQDLVQAVNGPAILYVKAGAPLPEVTLVVSPPTRRRRSRRSADADRRSSRRARSRPPRR